MMRARCGAGLLWLLSLTMLVAGCNGDACKDGAFAQNGLCVPTCPQVECGDGVCTRYFWPDGLFNVGLRCENHKTCVADCSNANVNLADIMFFALAEIDSYSFVPNPAQSVSVSGACSDGGEVAVSGTRGCTTYAGIKTCEHNFTYTFSNCVHVSGYPAGRVTFVSGFLTGSWGYVDTGTATPIDYDVSGQVTLGGTMDVGYILDLTQESVPTALCTVDFMRTAVDGTVLTIGSMCGKAITTPMYQP